MERTRSSRSSGRISMCRISILTKSSSRTISLRRPAEDGRVVAVIQRPAGVRRFVAETSAGLRRERHPGTAARASCTASTPLHGRCRSDRAALRRPGRRGRHRCSRSRSGVRREGRGSRPATAQAGQWRRRQEFLPAQPRRRPPSWSSLTEPSGKETCRRDPSQ